MWLKSEGFVDHIKTWWVPNGYQGSPSYVLAQKLKSIEIGFDDME